VKLKVFPKEVELLFQRPVLLGPSEKIPTEHGRPAKHNQQADGGINTLGKSQASG
jgi:hypothetical protein